LVEKFLCGLFTMNNKYAVGEKVEYVGNNAAYSHKKAIIVGTRQSPANSSENLKIIEPIHSPYHPYPDENSSDDVKKGAKITFGNKNMDFQIMFESQEGRYKGEIIECKEEELKKLEG